MVIGVRLKELRELKKLSQGDVEKRTGLLRCYISRVENGHTVPSVETLEKMARALEIHVPTAPQRQKASAAHVSRSNRTVNSLAHSMNTR
jgi:transcriptional regulator with XRE-family HTH domain